jgi:single-strand DNA-binding protein
MYDTTMTLIGNLVDSPKLRKTKNGHFVASFRVASTPRRYDREQGGWVDGKTLFVTHMATCPPRPGRSGRPRAAYPA